MLPQFLNYLLMDVNKRDLILELSSFSSIFKKIIKRIEIQIYIAKVIDMSMAKVRQKI